MTSSEFIIWLKGFTEACNDFHPTPKQWDRIKEVLNEVEDYNDNPGIDVEIDDWYPDTKLSYSLTGSGVINTSGSLNNITTGATAVWNDKMGCWHYTNYPEGFGYYTNSTLGSKVPEETKKQLLD